MEELDEETALAIVFANTKRKKRDLDLITIAKAFDFLVKLYRSRKAVAEMVGISTEMIREFLIALDLPLEVQKLLSERKIDSVDMISKISALKKPSIQIAVANAIVGLQPEDMRDITRQIKTANISPEEAKKIILNAKPKGMHIFIIDFDDQMYKKIKIEAENLNIRPAELVREIVRDWLEQKEKIDNK